MVKVIYYFNLSAVGMQVRSLWYFTSLTEADMQRGTKFLSLEDNIHLQKEEQIKKQEEYIQQQKEYIQQQKEHLDEVWKRVDQLQKLLSVREAEMYHLQSQSQMTNWNKPTDTTSLGKSSCALCTDIADVVSHVEILQAAIYEYKEPK